MADYYKDVIEPAHQKVVTGGEKFDAERAKRIKRFRSEASRLASKANKRLQRLEGNQLKDSPAYQSLVGDDGKTPRFGVRGKDYNQLQKEVARMNQFLNAETSTVRGANRMLKEMANNTGIQYKNLKELRDKAGKFFELASKIEQYLRTVEDMASAIGYQKIWNQINQYVKQNEIRLDDTETNIDEVTQKMVQAMDIYNEREQFKVEDEGIKITGWYQLPKD